VQYSRTVTDSMRQIVNGGTRPLDRDSLRIGKLRQTFKTGIILPAFQQPYCLHSLTRHVVEALGKKIYLIDGIGNINSNHSWRYDIADALLRSGKRGINRTILKHDR